MRGRKMQSHVAQSLCDWDSLALEALGSQFACDPGFWQWGSSGLFRIRISAVPSVGS